MFTSDYKTIAVNSWFVQLFFHTITIIDMEPSMNHEFNRSVFDARPSLSSIWHDSHLNICFEIFYVNPRIDWIVIAGHFFGSGQHPIGPNIASPFQSLFAIGIRVKRSIISYSSLESSDEFEVLIWWKGTRSPIEFNEITIFVNSYYLFQIRTKLLDYFLADIASDNSYWGSLWYEVWNWSSGMHCIGARILNPNLSYNNRSFVSNRWLSGL